MYKSEKSINRCGNWRRNAECGMQLIDMQNQYLSPSFNFACMMLWNATLMFVIMELDFRHCCVSVCIVYMVSAMIRTLCALVVLLIMEWTNFSRLQTCPCMVDAVRQQCAGFPAIFLLVCPMPQFCFACWCLSASVVVVCKAAHMQRNSPGGSTRRASRVTSRWGDTLF